MRRLRRRREWTRIAEGGKRRRGKKGGRERTRRKTGG